jgi:hypothetical protein
MPTPPFHRSSGRGEVGVAISRVAEFLFERHIDVQNAPAGQRRGQPYQVIDTVPAPAGFGAPSIANRCAGEPSLPPPYTVARIEAFRTCPTHRRMTERGGRHLNPRSLPASE